MAKSAWSLEELWIRRNKQGVIIEIREKPPELEELLTEKKETAAGQGD